MADVPTPNNFRNDWPGYARAIQNTYPGFDKLDTKTRLAFMNEAKRDWTNQNDLWKGVDKYETAEYKGGAYPAGTGPQGGGLWSRYVDQPYEQYVGKPLLRTTQSVVAGGLTGLFQGPYAGGRAAEDNWNNPGQHPYMRAAAHMVPVLGSETFEQAAFDVVAFSMGPQFRAFKALDEALDATNMAQKGSKFLIPAAKVGGKAAIGGTIGAAINAPRAESEGSLWPMIGGGIQGAAVGGVTGTMGLFGGKSDKLYQQGLSNELSGPGGFFPNLRGKLNKAADWADQFWRTKAGRSQVEADSRVALDAVEQDVKQAFGNKPWQMTWGAPEERQAVEALGEAHGGAEVPEQKPTAGRPATQPKEVPNPAYRPAIRDPKTGRMMKSGYPKTITRPGTPEIPPRPGTPAGFSYTWDLARQTLRQLRQGGWDLHGDIRNGDAGEMARMAYRRMLLPLAMEINERVGGLGTKWWDAITRDSTAQTLSNLFSKDGVIVGNRIVPNALQRAAVGTGKGSYMFDILESMGDQKGYQFLSRIMRGAGITAPKDVEAAFNMFMRVHPMFAAAHILHNGPVGALAFLGASIAGHPQMPYKAGFSQLSSAKALWMLSARLGVSGMLRAFADHLHDGPDAPPTTTAMAPSPG